MHLFAFALTVLGLEIFLLINENAIDLKREFFSLMVMAFFLFFCILEYVFGLFASGRASVLVTLIPAVILFFLLKEIETLPYIEIAVCVAVLGRVFSSLLPGRDSVITWGSLILDAVAIILRIQYQVLSGENSTDKLLFVCLSVLTLSTIQEILDWKKSGRFPFYYFVIVGILVAVLPMKQEPIDWSSAIEAGHRLVSGVKGAADSASYYLSFLMGDDFFTAGYSSLNVTGEKVMSSDRDQLILTSSEKPYRIFYDKEVDSNMKMRRNIYLSGGKGVDKESLARLLNFMHSQEVDREKAALFSEISKVNIQYVYLDTPDEIAPNNTIILTSGGQRVAEGVSDKKHKKGYSLSASYLDIDYGSPYLIELVERAQGTGEEAVMPYDEASSYMQSLYGIGLDKIMSKEDYEEFAKSLYAAHGPYVDYDGATDRMTELAKELTLGVNSDYEKCRIIEEYLRQYSYNTKALGGHDQDSDMSTPRGMADIADRFLFETQEGYCVHFTSSMVMLLRLSGIPARASYGYRYAYPFQQQDSYIVSSNCAHVWPEAYLEGIGWVPFEPTSAFMTAADFTWHRAIKTPAKGDGIANPATMSTPIIPEIPEPEEVEVGSEENTEDKTIIQVLNVVVAVVLSVILLIGLLVLGTFAIREVRYKHASPAKKLQIDVEMIKKILRQHYEGVFNDRGLLTDYIDIAPNEYRADVQRIFGAYYRSIYGNSDAKAISQSETEIARGLRQTLKKCK